MILLPRSYSSQPQTPVEIDRSNSITRGLATVFLPTQRYPSIDLITKVFDTATTRGSLLPGTNGVRYAVTGTGVNWSLNFAPVGIPASYPALTVFALFEQYDTTSSGVIWGGGNNSTLYANLFKSNDGSVGFGPNSNSGGSGINGPVLDTNRIYALAGINQGNYRELFVDGNSVISSNTSITFLNAAYAFAGSNYVLNQFRRIGLYCGYVWTRRLTPFEIKSLTDNPWQIFRPRRLQIPVSVTGTQTLTPSLYTNNQTFYSPTVTSTVTVSPSLYTNNQTFYAPTITQTTGQTVYPSLFTNTNIFFAAEAINEYPDPSQVEFGVKYGPGGTLVGTLTGGGGSSIIRLRSFTERH